MKLPNFFIVGAAKAGTTSLHQYLNGHPEVFMSTYKEPIFFCQDKITKDWETYNSYFVGSDNFKAVGEASTTYLADPLSPQMIKDVVPDAKIVIMLRNPVARSFSLYKWMARHGYENITTFREALDKEDSRFNDPNFRPAHADFYFNHLYYRSALYHDQVKRYLETFGAENCHIIISEEFNKNTDKSFKDLCRFLNIDDSYTPDYKIFNKAKYPLSVAAQYFFRNKLTRFLPKLGFSYNPQHPIANFFIGVNNRLHADPSIDPAIHNELLEKYTEDIKKTSQLIGKDLSSWLKKK